MSLSLTVVVMVSLIVVMRNCLKVNVGQLHRSHKEQPRSSNLIVVMRLSLRAIMVNVLEKVSNNVLLLFQYTFQESELVDSVVSIFPGVTEGQANLLLDLYSSDVDKVVSILLEKVSLLQVFEAKRMVTPNRLVSVRATHVEDALRSLYREKYLILSLIEVEILESQVVDQDANFSHCCYVNCQAT